MKSQSIAIKSVYKFLFIFVIFINLFFLIITLNTVNAQATPTPNQSANLQPTDALTVMAITRQIANSSCPEPIKNLLIDTSSGTPQPRTNVTFYLNGTFVVAKNGNTSIGLTCANANALQKLILRGVMIMFALVGLALVFGVGKSSLGMITSAGDTEKFQANVKGFVTAILYTIGVLFFYTFLMFIVVGVLGFGRLNNTRPEYNLFCQNQILFNLTFDRNDTCP